MKFLADLHMHSTFSDGKMSIPELVDYYGYRGFGAIAITDHLCESSSFLGKAAGYLKQTLNEGTFPLYMAILKSEAERALKEFNMVVIPGYELTKNSVSNFRSAHLLALGVNRFMTADGDAVDLARAVRAQGALVAAAHPVSTRKMEKQTFHLWDRREELAQEIDAWEVASGPYIFDEVMETTLPKIATSDLHVASQIISWKTVFDCERHPEAILRAIKKQELSFQFYGEEDTHYDNRHWFDAGGLGYRIGNNVVGDLVSA